MVKVGIVMAIRRAQKVISLHIKAPNIIQFLIQMDVAEITLNKTRVVPENITN